jgi:hypothetical protein
MTVDDVVNLVAGECPNLGLAGAEHSPARVLGVDATIVYRTTPRGRRPIEVLLAIVTHHDLHVGLRLAGRFGAYCPRLLVIEEAPTDAPWAAVEADYWGIGLLTPSGLLVAPEPFTDPVYTPAGDRFTATILTGRNLSDHVKPQWR